MNQITPMNGLFAAEYFDMASEEIGETFRIFVARPQVFEPGKKYPAIYVLDGNFMFAPVMEMQRAMAMSSEIPQAWVIGVGYAVEGGYLETINKRNRDYTPTSGGMFEIAMKRQILPEASFQYGGGPGFLKFLQEELKPAVEAAYSVDPDDSTIAGHSYGGLFSSWVLLTRSEAFQRYILCSPSIHWDGEAIWQWEARCAGERKDIHATVFVTAGGHETVECIKMQMEGLMSHEDGALKAQVETIFALSEKYGWRRMAEISPEFAEKLKSRNYPSLNIHCHNLPDETHMSVWPGAMSRGLRYVFGNWNP